MAPTHLQEILKYACDTQFIPTMYMGTLCVWVCVCTVYIDVVDGLC